MHTYKDKQKDQQLTDYGFSIPDSKDYWIAEDKNMATIKENAEQYVPLETKNVAELKQVSVDLDIMNKVVNEGTPEEFNYNYIIVDEIEYRVPNVVLKQLKAILAENNKVTHFKVLKDGEGLKTTYLVMVV